MLPKRVVNQSILADQKYPNTTEITLLNPELVIFLLRQICCFLEIIFEQLSTKLMDAGDVQCSVPVLAETIK